ncbi:hypothetical protein [Streptomyces sp. NPDC058683]|uniref:hypothetical protein n=1 Tax=Streptomyces sp. NPDC058683 TaxID=3346597 RepID=UPI0036536F6E
MSSAAPVAEPLFTAAYDSELTVSARLPAGDADPLADRNAPDRAARTWTPVSWRPPRPPEQRVERVTSAVDSSAL